MARSAEHREVSGNFCEAVLGQSAQILSRQCSPPPCHMQSTAARLCSMQGRFLEGVRGALPQDLLTSPPGLLHDTLVLPVLHAREIFRRIQGSASPGLLTSPPGLLHDTLVSPVLHAREIFRRVQGSASPGFAHISPRTAP